MHAQRRSLSASWKGLAPFVLVLVLIAAYFGLFDPYEITGVNILPASDFEDSSWRNEMPPGWRGLGELSRWGPTLGYEGSGGLEIRVGAERGGRVEWILDNPSRFSHVRVRGKLRAEDVEPGKRAWNLARLVFFCRDESGRSRWDFPHAVAYLVGTTRWRTYEATLEVPPGVSTGHLVVQQAGTRGRVFVDDLELLPARLKSSVMPVRRVLVLLWLGSFLVALATLAPWRRPAGVVATLLVIVIVVGVAAPADSFAELIKWQESFFENLRERADAPDSPRPVEHESENGIESEPEAAERTPPKPTGKTTLPDPDPVHVTSAVKDLKKHGHAWLFGLLGMSAALSYLWGRRFDLLMPLAGVLALFAASTELLQFMIARRQPTWFDLGVDLLGLGIGVSLASLACVVFSSKRGDNKRADKKTGEGREASP